MKSAPFIVALSLSLLACKDRGSTSSQFKVWGNCEMCKETIETSLADQGILSANWNVDTKMIEVEFDPAKISIEQIQQRIAHSGYDTEIFSGNDSSYAQLPACCQYIRKP